MRTILPATLLACLPVAAASGAPSSPRPWAASQACPSGGIAVPSARTCLMVSGRVRSDARLRGTPYRGIDSTQLRADARLRLDARTQTEAGPLRAVVTIGRDRH